MIKDVHLHNHGLLKISVADNGPGIAEAQQEALGIARRFGLTLIR